MSNTLKDGLTITRTFAVTRENTIGFMGEDARVYATPSLVHDIEVTCRDFMLEHLEDGEDSVGFEVSIKHLAPTLIGMEVTVTAKITEIDRAKVNFALSVTDQQDTICTGHHVRFIVNVEKTRQRLKAKAQKIPPH